MEDKVFDKTTKFYLNLTDVTYKFSMYLDKKILSAEYDDKIIFLQNRISDNMPKVMKYLESLSRGSVHTVKLDKKDLKYPLLRMGYEPLKEPLIPVKDIIEVFKEASTEARIKETRRALERQASYFIRSFSDKEFKTIDDVRTFFKPKIKDDQRITVHSYNTPIMVNELRNTLRALHSKLDTEIKNFSRIHSLYPKFKRSLDTAIAKIQEEFLNESDIFKLRAATDSYYQFILEAFLYSFLYYTRQITALGELIMDIMVQLKNKKDSEVG